jgi:alkylation response protein AidB-like acyl-CoA dehydrogenase
MMLHKQFTEEQAAEGFVAPNQTVSPSGTVSEVGESSLSFEIPEKLKPLREKVLKYMETWVYPLEALLHDEHNGLSPEARWQKIREAQAEAKKQDLWAIGHPVNLKGKGLPFMDYLFVNEVQGRSQLGQLCLGTYSLQDSLMMFRHGTGEIARWMVGWILFLIIFQREPQLAVAEDQQRRYLARIVAGDIRPSFAMTEPDVSSSDPTQLKTTAQLVGDEWVM